MTKITKIIFIWSIPEYLREDTDNQKYILFVDMVAQQYDNSWQYVKNITTRFNADNRLDFGISKDLVADAIRDFGIKLYSNNFNSNDLYTAFLGLTPSGSSFPFPNMTGSFPTPSGFEYVNTEISASNDIVPLDNVNKSLYKRIYHNIPYLLKTKGTLSGLRALGFIFSDTILRINEFGGKDRNDFQDWDYSQNVFNYAIAICLISSQITSSFLLIDKKSVPKNTPVTPFIDKRFLTPGVPTASGAYYNILVGDQNKFYVTLEYTGSGMESGSYGDAVYGDGLYGQGPYSGSIPSQSNAYGTLRFYPDGNNSSDVTASITLPFFDGGWWSAMATIDYDASNTGSLFAANRIGEKIGFSGSDSVGAVTQYWRSVTDMYIPSASGLVVDTITYLPLTGALQEVRYWDVPLSESLFYDYVVNPYSTQGNMIVYSPFHKTNVKEINHPVIIDDFFPSILEFANSGNSNLVQEIDGQSFVPLLKNEVIENKPLFWHYPNWWGPIGPGIGSYSAIRQGKWKFIYFHDTQIVELYNLGAFNLGDYIGDPRQISESKNSYPALDALRDDYFKKYINSYDVNDFIRLIKFFDNSLFKMIEDFTPARTTLSSGVVIKQNLLERNRQAPPSMSFTTPEYSGS